MKKSDFLYNQILKLSNENKKNKTIRCIIAISLIAVIFSLIFLQNEELNTFLDFIVLIICAFFAGVFYFYVNSIIFIYLIQKSQDEKRELEMLIKEYEKVKKEEQGIIYESIN